ncbi:hypothetical protein CIHG_00781 [Coccidioides immitis H538.4]|uniref:Acid phosphatase n=1 Tax=Coccidioides immitis H538.4 TaxID=396776 RepID=A0A0J8RG66_COCIT|nr:hypothetical protein CIHG_00781 [Coccidioides immitis H538.4]
MRSRSQSSGVLLTLAAILASLLATGASAETVLGAYIFSRHGDRTSKSTLPTVLTDLGYSQVYVTGQYYRERYLSDSSGSRIKGINPDIITPGQLAAFAPADEVLQNSATAFFQGLYPPVGNVAKSTLRNGTDIEAPMNGYQLMAIEQTFAGGNSEKLAWLQGASKCHNAKGAVGLNHRFLQVSRANVRAYATFLSSWVSPSCQRPTRLQRDSRLCIRHGIELVTDSSSSSFPDPSDISVRFLFNNGSIPYGKFSGLMEKISLSSKEEWCKACGSASGECATNRLGAEPLITQDRGLSTTQAGVVGAMITMGAILAAQALFMLIGGFRFVRKSKVVQVNEVAEKNVV